MVRYRYKGFILLVVIVLLGVVLLKKPIKEYRAIKNSDTEQLSKKFIQLKYSYLWAEDGNDFSLIGDSSTNKSTMITLKKDKLRVLNGPFSKSETVLF